MPLLDLALGMTMFSNRERDLPTQEFAIWT